eukprot:scaffold44800_cov57-Phaeocystis_antarctica.AAC.2
MLTTYYLLLTTHYSLLAWNSYTSRRSMSTLSMHTRPCSSAGRVGMGCMGCGRGLPRRGAWAAICPTRSRPVSEVMESMATTLK